MLAAKLCRLFINGTSRSGRRWDCSLKRTQHDESVHATVGGMLASAWSNVPRSEHHQHPGLAGLGSGRLSHAVFSGTIDDSDSDALPRGGTSAGNPGSPPRSQVPSSRRTAVTAPHAFRGDSSGFYTAAAANGTLLRPSTPTAGSEQATNGHSSTPTGASAYISNNSESAATRGQRIEQQDEQRRNLATGSEARVPGSMQQSGRSIGYSAAQPAAPSMALGSARPQGDSSSSTPGAEHAGEGSIPLQAGMQGAGFEVDASSSTRRRRGLLQRPERSVSSQPEPPPPLQHPEPGLLVRPPPAAGMPGPPRPPPVMPRSASPGPASYRRRGGEQEDDDDEFSDSGWAPVVVRRPPPKPRIARALPLQLIPISPGAGTLLDPDTGRPLVEVSSDSNSNGSLSGNRSSNSSAPASGVALPLLGPWMLSNSRDKFPASDALVNYNPVSRHGVQQWLGMRLEYVPQTDEQESEYEARIGDAITLPSQGFSGTPAWEADENGEDEFGYSRPSRPDPIATLQLFNLSRRRRGSAEAATFFVYSPASEEEGRGRTQAAIRPGDPGFPLRPGDVITLGSEPGAPRFRWGGDVCVPDRLAWETSALGG